MLDRAITQLPRFFTITNASFLLQAMAMTLALTALGCIVGLLLGAVIAVLRHTRGWL